MLRFLENICNVRAVNSRHPLNRGLIAWFYATPGGLQGGRSVRDLTRAYILNFDSGVADGAWRGGNPGGYGSHRFGGSAGARASQNDIPGYPLSISAWLRSETASGVTRRNAVSVHLSTTTSTTNHVGYIGVRQDQWVAGSEARIAASSNYSNNTWRYITGVFASSNSRTLYINGIQAATNTQGAGVGTIDELSIGGSATGAGFWFTGSIADTRIYDRALLDSEVRILYQQSMRGNPDLLTWSYSPIVFPSEPPPPGTAVAEGLSSIEHGYVHGVSGVTRGLHDIETGIHA